MTQTKTISDQLWSLPISELHQIKYSISDIIQTKIKSSLRVNDDVVVVSKSKREDGTITKINKTRAVVKIGHINYSVPFGMIEVK
tara:strand:+ start:77 stop:331 length:255 start_codon:yes stop_codon:yes gene_type:complete